MGRRVWGPCAGVSRSCSRVSVSSLWSLGDPTPRFWGTPGFQGSHSLPLPAQADAAPPAPRGGTRRGQQHRRLWRWGRSSSCSAGHAAASGRHPRCLREQRGASADLQGPHTPPAPHRGAEPLLHLNEGGGTPGTEGEHPPWGTGEGTPTLGCSAVAVRAGGGREAAPRSAAVLSRHQQLLGAGHLPLQRPGLARHFGDSGRHGPGQRLGAAPRFGGALGGDPPIVGGREGPDPAVQCPRQRPAGCGIRGGVSAGASTLVPPLHPNPPIAPSPAKCCDVPDSDKLSSDGSSSRSPTSGT